MSSTLAPPDPWLLADRDQRVELAPIPWELYVALNDAVNERRGPRMSYCDGRLGLLTLSRRHDWYAERIADLIKAVATGMGIVWEDAGSATFRDQEQQAGVEADKTFYLRDHAERMLGSRNIDLSTQPPPDIAVEVELSHPADDAVRVYARIGVPEVWRFDVGDWTFHFCHLGSDGSYAVGSRSALLAPLTSQDMLDQLRRAEELGAARWSLSLPEWVRTTVVARGLEG
jgi:Uma2 family endonuclease